MTLHEPLGVVGIIVPWNFPMRTGRVQRDQEHLHLHGGLNPYDD
nr:aldehyde dehydrogenase family protein [Kribbella sp. VKM Ac-2568]